LRVPHDEKHRDIDAVAQDIIRRKAHKLMRRGGFSSSDLPDLEQDLSLHLLQRMSAFDPRRGDWTAFVAAVVTTWGANLLRTRHAAKRDYRRTLPLLAITEPSADENNTQDEKPNEQAHDARLGRQRLSDQEQRELKMDVQQALQCLPEDLRPIAERLQHITIAELVRELGVPRTTLYESIERIRRRFQRMDLEKNR
jgi:RNA polymerase sigma-70 factor (ECF subfamily)